jgi:hypothetical protein
MNAEENQSIIGMLTVIHHCKAVCPFMNIAWSNSFPESTSQGEIHSVVNRKIARYPSEPYPCIKNEFLSDRAIMGNLCPNSPCLCHLCWDLFQLAETVMSKKVLICRFGLQTDFNKMLLNGHPTAWVLYPLADMNHQGQKTHIWKLEVGALPFEFCD